MTKHFFRRQRGRVVKTPGLRLTWSWFKIYLSHSVVSLGKTLYGTTTAWWSWQAVLNFNQISIKLKNKITNFNRTAISWHLWKQVWVISCPMCRHNLYHVSEGENRELINRYKNSFSKRSIFWISQLLNFRPLKVVFFKNKGSSLRICVEFQGFVPKT